MEWCGATIIVGGVHREVHQIVDYNFFTLSVNINNPFFRENQHQQRIWKINNKKLTMELKYNVNNKLEPEKKGMSTFKFRIGNIPLYIS